MKDLSEEIRSLINKSRCTAVYAPANIEVEKMNQQIAFALFDRFKDKIVLKKNEFDFFQLDVFVFTPDELKKILE